MSQDQTHTEVDKRSDVRQPVHWSERVRVILFLLVYVVLIESAYPTPFLQSSFGKLTYFIILLYVLKEVFRYRQERSPRFYRKVQRITARMTKRKFSVSDYTRYRIYRLMRFAFMFYALGWLIDSATTRCTGAFACATAIPTLIVQNLAELLGFAIRLAMSMFSLFGIMFLLARMDLHTTILPDSIKTRFTDIYGQSKAVERMKESRTLIDKPEIIESRGGYQPGGILITGPPGTGKSYLAEAMAGEVGKPFVSVGAESFASMWVGVPIMKVKMLFKHLRKLSVKHGGVICFMDEIDVIGSRGGTVLQQMVNKWTAKAMGVNETIVTGGGGAAGSGALQMLLTEMSGLVKPKGLYNKFRVIMGFKPVPPPKYRIVWIAATNLPEALDPALLRPGRFDRKIRMTYPNIDGRADTFRGYLNKIDHDVTEAQIDMLARQNPQATGASIKDAINEALLTSVREKRDRVSFSDVRGAILWKSMGEEDGQMEHEEDRRRVALHEAAHAVASHYFRPDDPITFASVVKRDQGTGGFVQALPLQERFTLKSKLEANIMVSLASVWAENFYFDGDVSAGPSSDLKHATNTAYQIETQLGMGESFVVYERVPMSDLPKSVRESIQKRLDTLYRQVSDFLYPRQAEVEAVAALLEDALTIEGDEIHELLRKFEGDSNEEE